MSAFDANLRRLRTYREVYGHSDPPVRYRTGDGFPLGHWVQAQKDAASTRTLSLLHREALSEVGVSFSPVPTYAYGTAFDFRLAQLEEFSRSRGHLNPSPRFLTDDGFALGRWLRAVKEEARAGTLPEAHRKAMQELGVMLPGQSPNVVAGIDVAVPGPGLRVILPPLLGVNEEAAHIPLGTPLDALALHVRTYNALRRHGVTTVEQVLDMAQSTGFGCVLNFGAGCLRDLEHALLQWKRARKAAEQERGQTG